MRTLTPLRAKLLKRGVEGVIGVRGEILMSLGDARLKIFLSIIYISMILVPVIMIYGIWNIPDTFQGDVTFINGLITASGILFGFTAAMVASQQLIPRLLRTMLVIDVALLLYAGLQILTLALDKDTYQITIAFVSASFNANAVTALSASFWRFPRERTSA